MVWKGGHRVREQKGWRDRERERSLNLAMVSWEGPEWVCEREKGSELANTVEHRVQGELGEQEIWLEGMAWWDIGTWIGAGAIRRAEGREGE